MIQWGIGRDMKMSLHLVHFSPARGGWFTACGDRPASEEQTQEPTFIDCTECLEIALSLGTLVTS